jgi:hypothetical protein
MKATARTVTLTRNHENKIEEVGIDQPAATIITETDTHIVIKIPSHTYWAGLYMPRGYASPETAVYEKVEPSEPGAERRFHAAVVVAWENSRKSNKS